MIIGINRREIQFLKQLLCTGFAQHGFASTILLANLLLGWPIVKGVLCSHGSKSYGLAGLIIGLLPIATALVMVLWPVKDAALRLLGGQWQSYQAKQALPFFD